MQIYILRYFQVCHSQENSRGFPQNPSDISCQSSGVKGTQTAHKSVWFWRSSHRSPEPRKEGNSSGALNLFLFLSLSVVTWGRCDVHSAPGLGLLPPDGESYFFCFQGSSFWQESGRTRPAFGSLTQNYCCHLLEGRGGAAKHPPQCLLLRVHSRPSPGRQVSSPAGWAGTLNSREGGLIQLSKKQAHCVQQFQGHCRWVIFMVRISALNFLLRRNESLTSIGIAWEMFLQEQCVQTQDCLQCISLQAWPSLSVEVPLYDLKGAILKGPFLATFSNSWHTCSILNM